MNVSVMQSWQYSSLHGSRVSSVEAFGSRQTAQVLFFRVARSSLAWLTRATEASYSWSRFLVEHQVDIVGLSADAYMLEGAHILASRDAELLLVEELERVHEFAVVGSPFRLRMKLPVL